MLKILLFLFLGPAKHYQVCTMSASSGEVYCSAVSQSKADAEKKALAVNALAQGSAVAWVQQVRKGPAEPKVPQAPKLPSLTLPSTSNSSALPTEHNLDAYGREANR